MILDGGSCEIGLESPIVKLDGDSVTLLRPGAITADALACVCERVIISPTVKEALAEGERPLSPGMKYKHYAPSAPLILVDGDEDMVLSFLLRAQNAEKCAILCYREELDYLRNERLIDIGRKDDLAEQGRCLFAALRKTEEWYPDVIYAHLPPTEGLGLALYNRLIRAAAHTVLRV
jgi:L-threonylcarbamoyladenylate synthase